MPLAEQQHSDFLAESVGVGIDRAAKRLGLDFSVSILARMPRTHRRALDHDFD